MTTDSQNNQAVDSTLDKQQIARNKYAAYESQMKKGRSTKVKIALAVLILLAIAIGSWFLMQKFMQTGSGEQEIYTGYAMRGTLGVNISGWGSAAPKEKAEIGGKIIGTIDEVYVSVGKEVKKGDALFKIDAEETREKLSQANKEYMQLSDRVNSLRQDVENLVLTTPFDGHLIQAEKIKKGEYVNAGQSLGRLVDDSTMSLSLYFTYGYLGQIKEGMSAKISVPATMTTLTGKVDSVEPIRKVNPDGTICFRVNFSMKNPGTLTEGLEATAYIVNNQNEKLLPYDYDYLAFSQEINLVAKSSGESVKVDLIEYSDYKKGQELLILSNNNLIQTLEDEEKSLVALGERVSDLAKQAAETITTSPINGLITSLVIQPGSVLSGAGTPALVIADLSEMAISTNIDEIDISHVQLGMPVSVQYDQMEGTVFMEGIITELSYEATSAGDRGGPAYFPATISVNNPGALKPGMGVSYYINAITKEDCLMVPSAAIINTEFGPAVFIPKSIKDQFPEILDLPEDFLPKDFVAIGVTIGLSDANNTEIIEGLEEGTEVYLQQSNMPNYGGGIIF